MTKEIERKFLIQGDAWRRLAEDTAYRQGYLSTAEKRAVRVRTVSDDRVVCGMTTASRATALGTAAAQAAAGKLAADLDGATIDRLAGREYYGEYVCDFTTKPGATTDDPKTHLTFGYATQVVILSEDGKLERVVAAVHPTGRACPGHQ